MLGWAAGVVEKRRRRGVAGRGWYLVLIKYFNFHHECIIIVFGKL